MILHYLLVTRKLATTQQGRLFMIANLIILCLLIQETLQDNIDGFQSGEQAPQMGRIVGRNHHQSPNNRPLASELTYGTDPMKTAASKLKKFFLSDSSIDI